MQTCARRHPAVRRPTSPCHQSGIVTGAAQLALAIVSLVLGGTVLSLEQAREQAADQVVDIHATYLRKAADALQTALDRAVADNGLSQADVDSLITLDGAVAAGRVGLFDAALDYGRRPRWPGGLLVEGVEGAGRPRWSDEGPQVMIVPGIDLAVCRRYNEMVQGARRDEAPPMDVTSARRDIGWQQGCVAGAQEAAGTWFMAAFATADCLGSLCRDGDAVGESVRRMIADIEAVSAEADGADDTNGADGTKDPFAALVDCVARAAVAGERDPEAAVAGCAAAG